MSKRKVFLIFQTPDNGGTRTFFYQLINFLLKNKYEIFLLVKNDEISEIIRCFCREKKINLIIFNKNDLMDICITEFCPIKNFLLKLYNYLKQIFYLRKIYHSIKPDIVIISQGWPFTWFRALLLPGEKIFFQHVMPLHSLDKGNKFLLKLGLFNRRCTFVSVSNFCLNKMKEYWIGSYKKTEVIHNYYESENCSKTQQPHGSTDITILALARVEDGKNPFMWIEIAEKILKERKNISFIWAGKGTLLKEAKERTKGTNKISFIGFKSDVQSLYKMADIYFVPSKRESHGISEVGAMANGLPVIATSNGGTVESILDGHNGFIVDVTDKIQMIDRLLKLIDAKELRNKMGMNGKKRWEFMFTSKIWKAKMDILLKNRR